MDLREYARLLAEFKQRVGGRPPSMLTEDGAIDYMRRTLSELPPPNGNHSNGQPAKRD